MSTVSK